MDPRSKGKPRGRVYVGTSGWSYPHWEGIFYPPGLKRSDWFGYYSSRFDTVEINNTLV